MCELADYKRYVIGNLVPEIDAALHLFECMCLHLLCYSSH